MSAMFRSFADVVMPEDLRQYVKVPAIATGRRQIVQNRHRGLDPAIAMRHPGLAQAQFDPGQGSRQRQVVEIAQMADPEHLAGELATPLGGDDVELVTQHA